MTECTKGGEGVGVATGPHERVYDLEERTAMFGEAVIEFAKRVPRGVITDVLVRQIVRSGTSVGANYCEADDAASMADFRHNINRCKKEARETKHWVRMIVKAVPELRDAGPRSGRKPRNWSRSSAPSAHAPVAADPA